MRNKSLVLALLFGLAITSAHPGVALNDGLPSLALAEPPSDLVGPAADSTQASQAVASEPAPTDTTSADSQTAIVPIWPFSPLSGPVGGTPLANFGVVEEGIIYRCAQPTSESYRWLREQGRVKGVVSFRKETGDVREYVLNRGFRNFLWLIVEDENPPTRDQAELFLSFVTDSRNWPVVVYCKVGLGRTGTMVALIRYAVDGWSMEDAIEEARIYRGGVDVVQSQLDWLRGWAKDHPPASHRFLLSGQPASP